MTEGFVQSDESIRNLLIYRSYRYFFGQEQHKGDVKEQPSVPEIHFLQKRRDQQNGDVRLHEPEVGGVHAGKAPEDKHIGQDLPHAGNRRPEGMIDREVQSFPESELQIYPEDLPELFHRVLLPETRGIPMPVQVYRPGSHEEAGNGALAEGHYHHVRRAFPVRMGHIVDHDHQEDGDPLDQVQREVPLPPGGQ